jgi:hypothetical protein
LLRVVVRLGDYNQDSYFTLGVGSNALLPLDNDPIALATRSGSATTEAYKKRRPGPRRKNRSVLKQFSKEENPVTDFRQSRTPVQLVEPTLSLKVDADVWEERLSEAASNLYRDYPDIQSCLRQRAASRRRTTIFSTPKAPVTRNGKAVYTVQFSASTQASDGMRLGRTPAWTVAKMEELPTREKLLQDGKSALDTLVALRKAPIVDEEYRGPVLFSPDAADDIVASLIGGNILGRKPQLGAPNRTSGAFATSYKSRILPAFVNVVDDPTMKDFQGKSLIGSYAVDSEGVKAQPVDIVSKGVLTNYLVGRQPIRDFPESNGHGRAAPAAPPLPSLGVLLVKPTEPQSPEALKKHVMELVGNGGQPFGYRVETMAGPAPRLLYRVYARDGHEELVRGAVFSELDVRALRSDLSALGNDPLVSNRIGGLPATVISPSLLFDELQVKRADTSKDKLPEYPAPALK